MAKKLKFRNGSVKEDKKEENNQGQEELITDEIVEYIENLNNKNKKRGRS